jgi:hypothetical protein
MNEQYAGHFPEHRSKGAYLQQLPVRIVSSGSSDDDARCREVSELVRRILGPHARHSARRPPISRHLVQTPQRVISWL